MQRKRVQKRMPKEEKAPLPESDEIFEVERILGKRYNGKNEEFLIKWKYYGEEENSWEPKENLYNCINAIIEFQVKQKEKELQDHYNIIHRAVPPPQSEKLQDADKQTLVKKKYPLAKVIAVTLLFCLVIFLMVQPVGLK